MSELTYPEIGATRDEPLPAGYDHLHHRAEVGRGDAVFDRAGRAVTTFEMHRRSGVRVVADADRAAPGVRVGVGFGPLLAPCEVVWTADGHGRAGFGYGTLPGHPETGEEAFLVERGADGRVWFTVTAFSRPVSRLARLGGPLTRLAQRLYARRLARTLRRICAGSRTVGA